MSGKPTNERRSTSDPAPSARLLVVDDEDLGRRFVAASMREKGYAVHDISSAEKALERLQREPYDLVLMDVVMPGMDGIEALVHIKANWENVDVIMMTGYASMDAAVELMKAGASDFITKPINAEHLYLIIEKTLYRRSLERIASERDHYERLCRLDGLTGVYNHRFLQQMLDAEISRCDRYGHHISMLMIDVDDFKRYNDVNGHPAGDKLLRELAELLQEQTRAADFVARYGGEEFAIVLTETDKAGGATFAERLVLTVAQTPFDHEESQPQGSLTVSIGVAGCPEDAAAKNQFIKMADVALYRAKTAGKNQICVYDEAERGEQTVGHTEGIQTAEHAS